jgi:peptidyl-prolyl cis-trans isomerase B (cyclophilin B)
MSRTLGCFCLGAIVCIAWTGGATPAQRRPSRPAPARPAPKVEPPAPVRASRAATMTVEELKAVRAVIETAEGNMTLEFSPEAAPNHVRNFLRLAEQGFYDGTTFSRIVPGFVIQGGNPATRLATHPNAKRKYDTPKLKAEFNATPHEKGTLSMARTDDPDSADTHFFICTGRAASLDGKYTAFGRVVEGLETVAKIESQALTPGTDAPAERIEVKSVRVLYPPSESKR